MQLPYSVPSSAAGEGRAEVCLGVSPSPWSQDSLLARSAEAILLHVLVVGKQRSCLCCELPGILGTAARTLLDLRLQAWDTFDSEWTLTGQGEGDGLSQPTGPWGLPDLQLHAVSSCPLHDVSGCPAKGFCLIPIGYTIKRVLNKA